MYMQKDKIKEIGVLLARIVVGLVFVFFSLDKIADPASFAKQIVNYQMFPLFSINLIALILPWIELILGFMLLAGVKLKTSSLFTAVLLVMFMIAVGAAMVRGLDINCGCSGPHSQRVGFPKLAENTGLVLLCAAIFFFPSKKWKLGAK